MKNENLEGQTWEPDERTLESVQRKCVNETARDFHLKSKAASLGRLLSSWISEIHGGATWSRVVEYAIHKIDVFWKLTSSINVAVIYTVALTDH